MNKTHHQLTSDNTSKYSIIRHDSVTMQRGKHFLTISN